MDMSFCYFELKQYDNALTQSKKAVELAPDNAAAWSNLGALYYMTDKPWDAIAAYKKALELDPNQPAAMINLGTLYLAQAGRLDEAIEALKKAQELDPNNAEVHYRLGIAYNKQGRHNVAIECLSRAVELNAKHCDAMNALGGIYVWFYKKDTTQTDFLKKGLQHWNASLEVNPQQAHIVALVSKWSKELK